MSSSYWDRVLRARISRRRALLTAGTTSAAALLLAACGGGGGTTRDTGITVATVTPAPTEEPLVGPYGVIGQINPDYHPASELSGMAYPVVGGCLPEGPQLMPNAPRPYRNGIHEGVDFFDSDNCTPIARGLPIVASHAGLVTRTDHDYVNPTLDELNHLIANPHSEEALDRFRGKQVWLDHGGIVTRYCHLDAIEHWLQPGHWVEQGQPIAYLGESGTPESVTEPHSGLGYHLHWEVRVGDSFLGADLQPGHVRELYQLLFS